MGQDIGRQLVGPVAQGIEHRISNPAPSFPSQKYIDLKTDSPEALPPIFALGYPPLHSEGQGREFSFGGAMPATLEVNGFLLTETDQCSAVTHTDWPTRQNDFTCTQRALHVCQQHGCEAALCVVHMELCPKCKREFCEGCLEVHSCK